MSIYAYGIDLKDRSPKSQMLLRELANAGFGRVESVTDPKELRFKTEGYVLTFGSDALEEITGQRSISERRGEMHPCKFNDDLLVFSTWSPGFLYHNKENLPLFRDDLKLFKTVIKLDQKGVLD